MKTSHFYFAVFVFLASCVPTETGNPPAAPPESKILESDVLDTAVGPAGCEDAGVADGGACPSKTLVRVSGRADVTEEGAEIWVFDLQTDAAPKTASLSSEGVFSFSLAYAGEPSLYQMQLRTSEPTVFYKPVLFTFEIDGGETALLELEHPDAGCLEFSHTVRWEAEGRARIAVTNQCSAQVSVAEARSWSGMSNVVSTPSVFEPGQRAAFELAGDATSEDLLIIETGAAKEERLAIHLIP